MRNNLLIIMKKEFARFFGDRRMLFTALIMPGLLLYIVYSLMGNAISGIVESESGESQTVYVCNPPGSDAQWGEGFNFEEADSRDIQNLKEEVQNQEIPLLAVFPADFDQAVARGDAPELEIYYNSSSFASQGLYQTFIAQLDAYQIALSPKFTIFQNDLTQPGDSGQFNILASMLPMLLMVFFFSGCLSVAPESIAGEKERGTIATLLVTPIRAWVLAAGKILSLTVIAFLCGLSSGIGAVLGLNSMTASSGEDLSISAGGPKEYLLIVLIILSTICLLTAFISIISAFSKSVKEANTAAVPLLFISIMVGILPMLGAGTTGDMASYAIPLYGAVICLGKLFSSDYSVAGVLLAVASNVIFAGAGGLLLGKMFQSEKIIMTK